MTLPADLYGSDLSSLDDLDETRVVTGVLLVAQDAIWRLKTPPAAVGILAEDAPGYGLDLLEALGSVANENDAAALPARIKSQLTEDERILDVTATIVRTVQGPAVAWDITIHCTTAEGPFDLVGRADSAGLNLAVRLLSGVS